MREEFIPNNSPPSDGGLLFVMNSGARSRPILILYLRHQNLNDLTGQRV